jgi:uncharacterized protein YndB with AHSA1/START domain
VVNGPNTITTKEVSMAFREASRDTKAPPSEVWRVWSDVKTWPEWNPDMKESRLDGPLQLGTTGMINTQSGGKHDVVVTQFEDGKSFELESTAMPMTKMAIRATVTPIDGGTRVTQAFEARGLLAPIVGPMMGGMILKTFSQVLAGLAEKVESA